MSQIKPVVYNPLVSGNSLTIGGATVTDFAPDTMLTLSKNNDHSSFTVGVDGFVVINALLDMTGTLTLALKTTSPFNKVLADYYNKFLATVRAGELSSAAGSAAAGGIVQAASSIAGQNGLFKVEGTFVESGLRLDTWGMVQSQNDYSLASEVPTMEWVLGLTDANLKPDNSALGQVLGAAQSVASFF
jgi:hypothetical protein